MKKISKAFLLCGILAVLTACGEAKPAGNLAQNITMGAGSNQGNAEKDNAGKTGGDQESKAANQGKQKEEKGAFGFLYEGVTLIPGETFDQSVLGVCSGVSEVPSCAFDGNDRVYNYEKFELTAYIEENGERIYSIYFIDPNLPTTEGLCLGDSVDDMKAFYGEDCETNGTSCNYTRGNTVLSIIIQNDIVVGIEYRLNR